MALATYCWAILRCFPFLAFTKETAGCLDAVRDLFGQARWEFTSEGPDFYNYSNFSRQSRIVMVNLRVNINNYKQNNERNGGGEMNGGGGGDF